MTMREALVADSSPLAGSAANDFRSRGDLRGYGSVAVAVAFAESRTRPVLGSTMRASIS